MRVVCLRRPFDTLLIVITYFLRTGGGSRRRGRGGKARRAPRPGVSAADLDAEMEVGL